MRTLQVVFFFWLVAWPLTTQAERPDACLILSAVEPERTLASLPLEPEIPFSLEFINSIYLAPVRETFLYQPGEGLFIIRVESPSEAVFEYYGLTPQRPGSAELKRRLGDVRLLSHDYQNHRLVLGDKTLRLKGLVPDGDPLIMRVRAGKGCEP